MIQILVRCAARCNIFTFYDKVRRLLVQRQLKVKTFFLASFPVKEKMFQMTLKTSVVTDNRHVRAFSIFTGNTQGQLSVAKALRRK